MIPAHIIFSALDGDAVIPDGNLGPDEKDIGAALRIETVRVRRIVRIGDPDIHHAQTFAVIGMDCPARGIADLDALDPDIFAAVQENGPGPPGDDPLLLVLPPVSGCGISVDRAASHNIDVRDIDSGDEGSKDIQRIPLPGSEVQFFCLIC